MYAVRLIQDYKYAFSSDGSKSALTYIAVAMNKNIDRYVDILIVTALDEERFLLDKVCQSYLNGKFSGAIKSEKITTAHHRIERVVITVSAGVELCIAWTCLGREGYGDGNSMGNLFAYNACVDLANLLGPRFILLLGIAGGGTNTFELGDVGFGIQTNYSSYGKVKAFTSIEQKIHRCKKLNSNIKKQLLKNLILANIDPAFLFPKHSLRKVSPVYSDENFCGVAGQRKNEDEWKKKAKVWFYKYKPAFIKKSYATKYQKQQGFKRGIPSAFAGVVASGDTIIANPALQKAITEQFSLEDASSKRNIAANMFEMESYGVGLFCKSHNIEFGMIKGICDLAGNKKNDKFRLCALSSATAFALDVISDTNFYNYLLGIDKYRIGAGRTACIWQYDQNTHMRCVGELGDGERVLLQCCRPCTKPITQMMNAKAELIGARLFRAESKAYSDCVQSFINANLVSATKNSINKLLLLFPYSIHDLLAFFRNTGSQAIDKKCSEQIVKLGKWTPGITDSCSIEDIRTSAIYLGNKFHQDLEHFKIANEQCAKWIVLGKPLPSIAQKICRVMFIRPEDREHLADDPRFLMHVIMCGICVPTLIANSGPINKYGSDEATYFTIETAVSTNSTHKGKSNTLCLKYSDRSQLLASLGRCDTLHSPTAEDKEFGIFRDILNWIRDNLQAYPSKPYEPSSSYEIFPMLGLLQKHYPQLNTNQLIIDKLFPNYKYCSALDKQEIQRYFDKLLTIEHVIMS